MLKPPPRRESIRADLPQKNGRYIALLGWDHPSVFGNSRIRSRMASGLRGRLRLLAARYQVQALPIYVCLAPENS